MDPGRSADQPPTRAPAGERAGGQAREAADHRRAPGAAHGAPSGHGRLRERAHERREQLSARMRAWRHFRRWSIGAVGTAVVLAGLALVPLPGPGWLIVFVGLGILASEFEWAERLLHWARAKVHGWTQWARRQPLSLRVAAGLVGLVGLAATLFAMAWFWGLLPDSVRDFVSN